MKQEEYIDANTVLYKWMNGEALPDYKDHQFTTDGRYLYRNFDLVGIRTGTFSYVVKTPSSQTIFSWDGVASEILEMFFEEYPEYRACVSFIDSKLWNATPKFRKLADENCEQIPF